MSDRPQDRPEDRRRRGPLGDEENTEENRPAPRAGGPDGPNSEGAATRRGSAGDTGSGEPRAADGEETAPRRTGEEVDPETRVIRTPGTSGAPEDEAMLYTREERLREVYGGGGWVGGVIGGVFGRGGGNRVV